MVKDKRLFHKLLDIVLDKEPESGADMNVSSLKYTASVWLCLFLYSTFSTTLQIAKYPNQPMRYKIDTKNE